MKKTLLVLSVASLIIGCKKISQGENHGVIKIEENVERYDDTHQGGDEFAAKPSTQHIRGADAAKTKVKVDLNGEILNAYENGLEQILVNFLKSGTYAAAANDVALKDIWFDFDHVNFKMGSANQLEPGSEEQLQNLAKILKAYPDAKIKIGGYTDNTGDATTNIRLSQERADFIKSELTKLRVGNQVIGAEGYGSKFATVAKDKSDEERAVDRRMAVRFTK